MLDTKTTKAYSISKDLRSKGKSNEEFEIMIARLKLEELIALKLELMSKIIHSKMYGMPIYRVMTKICREAITKYAISVCTTYREAAVLLGVDVMDLEDYRFKYGLKTRKKKVNKQQTA